MTLIEATFFAVMCVLGWAAARLVHPIGGFWLSIPGFFAGFLLIPGLGYAYGRYRKWLYRGDADMPACSCGSTKFKYEKVGDEYHLLCQGCKTRYEKRPYEVSVYEGATKKPYKRLVRHQGWI